MRLVPPKDRARGPGALLCLSCPFSGKLLSFFGCPRAHSELMADPEELEELVAFLVRTSPLSAPQARRVVGEVLSFLAETPEAFIRRRHLALQARGLANDAIFSQLAAELDQ